jgi:hypothetical protein
MAKRPNLNGNEIESHPKIYRQGMGKHTKCAATSRMVQRKSTEVKENNVFFRDF